MYLKEGGGTKIKDMADSTSMVPKKYQVPVYNDYETSYNELMAKTMDVTKRPERAVSTLNPKQEAFLDAYYNPSSETFANVYRSALKVGYSESYARLMKAPARNNKWITIENYAGRAEMQPEHIVAGIERIVLKPHSQDKDKLKALELLAKLQGMLVDKSIVGHVNIEQALADLK